MKFIPLIIALIVIAVAVIGYIYFQSEEIKAPSITTFQECVDAGYPVMESYPARCATSDGQSFTEDIGNELEKENLIRSEFPRPNQRVSGTLQITGQARGTWFFEASFPVVLKDMNDNVITTAVAQADGEWMTESFVPYAATLTIPESFSGPAQLVLEKDNPSGLPEQADELRIPVIVEAGE